MAVKRNEFHVVAFDPGGITGWAHFIINMKAFTSPKYRVAKHVIKWGTGEYEGDEFEILTQCTRRIHRARYGPMPFLQECDIVTEDFQLMQTIGGKDLLSPVRINAVLDWNCRLHYGLRLQYQARNMRTNVTPERLDLMGYHAPNGRKWVKSGKGKDSFAAMQNAVTWLKRVKLKADERPWKADTDGVIRRS